MSKISKYLAGALAFTMLTAVGCGTVDDTSTSDTDTSTVEETSAEPQTTNAIKTNSETLSSGDTSTEVTETSSESGSADTPTRVEDDLTATQLEVLSAVDKGLTAFQTADIEGIYDYTDLIISYYIAYGKTALKEEVLAALEEEGTDIVPMEEGMIEWKVSNIAPISDDRYAAMANFLYNEIDTWFEQSDGNGNQYYSFSKVKEAFNIADIYCVEVEATYPLEPEDGVMYDMMPVEYSNSCFYVFKMDGEWKLDLPYSMYYTFSVLAAEMQNEIHNN